MNFKAVNILLVEDNPADIRLTQEAIEESNLNCNLRVVNDGEAAIEFLNKEGQFTNAERPDIIILDLNLPKKDGMEVLKEVKENENLKSIPVVVLTVSTSDEDRWKAYNLHANCYITKPLDFIQFINVVKSIQDFWFKKVKLPSKLV
jgi:two-component system, chemotaxis family, response regulator Rcp1